METAIETEGTPVRSLKVTSERCRNMFGKRSSRYVARLADTGWEHEADTKEQALEGLAQALARAELYAYTRRYVRKGGVTFALFYANGWQYDIVHDDGKTSGCLMACETYPQALAQMMRHVADYGE